MIIRCSPKHHMIVQLLQFQLSSGHHPNSVCVPGASSLSFRSHTCGELTLHHLGEKVTLCGWVQYLRYSTLTAVCILRTITTFEISK